MDQVMEQRKMVIDCIDTFGRLEEKISFLCKTWEQADSAGLVFTLIEDAIGVGKRDFDKIETKFRNASEIPGTGKADLEGLEMDKAA